MSYGIILHLLTNETYKKYTIWQAGRATFATALENDIIDTGPNITQLALKKPNMCDFSNAIPHSYKLFFMCVMLVFCGECADLGGGVICGCGPHGPGVAAVAQLSQCKASKRL